MWNIKNMNLWKSVLKNGHFFGHFCPMLQMAKKSIKSMEVVNCFIKTLLFVVIKLKKGHFILAACYVLLYICIKSIWFKSLH